MTATNQSLKELKEQLKKQYVGKTLLDIPTPAALLDREKIKRNCNRMLEVADTLELGLRVHIKTHKTEELTRFQLGNGTRPANIIVSTIKEAESIVPLLLELKNENRAVNILYGFPVLQSGAARLAAVSKQLGPDGLSLLVDHSDQLPFVYQIKELSGNLPQVYIKIDMGYGRAGVPPQSQLTSQLISNVLSMEEVGVATFHGLYTHAGHSYQGNNVPAAIDLLCQEFEALLVAATPVASAIKSEKLVLSVGATPTTTSVRNLLVQDSALTDNEHKAIATLKRTIQEIKTKGFEIELHAGVYTVLDIQQLATHALSGPMLGWPDLALTVLVEVASIYPSRAHPEALIAAGSLALGREPCKAYSGWGIVSPWNITEAKVPENGPEAYNGWIVGRISQEHGILTCNGKGPPLSLAVGQKIQIFPNHACVTGAGFDWYFVFDLDKSESSYKIVDVWPRWRGW